jgi:hypothetical protein
MRKWAQRSIVALLMAAPLVGSAQTMKFSPSEVVLTAGPSSTAYISPNITLQVTSPFPKYRIFAVFGFAKGPDGPLNSSQVSLIPVINGVTNSGFFTQPQSLQNSVKVFEGTSQGAIGSFRIAVNIPQFAHSGDVEGSVGFLLDNMTDHFTSAAILKFKLEVPKWIAAKFGGTSMDFVSNLPGNVLSNQTPSVTITTNDTDGAQVSLQLSKLVLTGSTVVFPQNRTLVATGTSASNAITSALTASLGTGALSPVKWTAPFGSSVKFTAGRVQTASTDKKGAYVGTLILTATVQ